MWWLIVFDPEESQFACIDHLPVAEGPQAVSDVDYFSKLWGMVIASAVVLRRSLRGSISVVTR
ncbi:MAG: hypothetical protein U9N46_11255 [Euryarchaeota archaeon]|nr:hypothetical protein [Euryarchaeota archaeon]